MNDEQLLPYVAIAMSGTPDLETAWKIVTDLALEQPELSPRAFSATVDSIVRNAAAEKWLRPGGC